MKILVAGDWHSDLHEQEVLNSLTRLGHEVHEFKWHHYYSFKQEHSAKFAALSKRAQNKYLFGPIISRVNRDFISKILKLKPAIVFVYRGTHIYADSLEVVKKALPRCVLVGYNNDDPFSPSQPKYLWRHFIKAVPNYDLMLAYRHSNITALYSAGAKRVELMRSWYVAERNYPVELSQHEKSKFSSDVVFIGHYEPDQRLAFLEEVVRQGFELKIFGPSKYWSKPLRSSPLLKHLAPIEMVWGNDYNRALCGAKVALCFLSKLNRDTYTRRCFEIPATKTLMLSEYSKDLTSLFSEGVEADYFQDMNEFIEKVKHYVESTPDRERIAQCGFDKVKTGGHDIDSRMRIMLNQILSVRNSEVKYES